ncbi:MAG: hypothetical protein IKI09_11170 [Bacteroidales bacterium]|nr:hypothetical protein [Bacteroidales bacterium]
MMKLVDSKGKVLLEREKQRHTTNAKTSSVRTKRLPKGFKKTVSPILMSEEQFVNSILQNTTNGNV